MNRLIVTLLALLCFGARADTYWLASFPVAPFPYDPAPSCLHYEIEPGNWWVDDSECWYMNSLESPGDTVGSTGEYPTNYYMMEVRGVSCPGLLDVTNHSSNTWAYLWQAYGTNAADAANLANHVHAEWTRFPRGTPVCNFDYVRTVYQLHCGLHTNYWPSFVLWETQTNLSGAWQTNETTYYITNPYLMAKWQVVPASSNDWYTNPSLQAKTTNRIWDLFPWHKMEFNSMEPVLAGDFPYQTNTPPSITNVPGYTNLGSPSVTNIKPVADIVMDASNDFPVIPPHWPWDKLKSPPDKSVINFSIRGPAGTENTIEGSTSPSFASVTTIAVLPPIGEIGIVETNLPMGIATNLPWQYYFRVKR